MKRLVGPLVGLWLVVGCGGVAAGPAPAKPGGQADQVDQANQADQVDQADQGHGLPRDVKTAGGCACPAEWGAAAEVSIDCFCAEFPSACPSYDDLKTPTTPPDGLHSQCVDDSSWGITEQVGCGRLTISQAGTYGGWTYVYDEQTHELIGAATSTDFGHGACGASTYYGGVRATCSEGVACSVCDTTREACVPACSMEALRHHLFFGFPQLAIKLRDCSGVDPALRPLVTTGCGRITVTEGSGSSTFDATSYQAVAMVTSNTDGFCGGHWGEAPAACAEQSTCSLCEGAPNACGR
jgi:hypothetical protein